MYKFNRLIFFLLFGSFQLGFVNQVEPFDEIIKRIRSGNAQNVSFFFNSTIELAIPGYDDTYSKSQAEILLKEFFNRNIPLSCSIDHKGFSGGTGRFANGTYESKDSKYKIYILLKNQMIYELRFDKW